jgi:acyl-CoA synthetase (AMP-forming)/AMP-acid ligase II
VIIDCNSPDLGKGVPPGEYTVHFNVANFFPHEVEAVVQLANAFLMGVPLRLTLVGEESETSIWICDAISTKARPHVRFSNEIVLYTSGTTGVPKTIRKSSEQLRNAKHGSGSTEDVWLLTYAPFRWAGLSVILHALKIGCKLCVPRSLSVEHIAERMNEVTHIGLTPSLFRKIVLSQQQREFLGIGQVTFGGEVCSQAVLDVARQVFPNARLTHIYASTEFGDICSVSDGKAGYPEAKFRAEKFTFSEDGQLYIDGKETGDYWELKEDRYYFIGRKEEIVNVGGEKFSLQSVEEAAYQIMGIEQVRARAVPSPLLGSLIVLDYVGHADGNEILAKLRTTLPRLACPAMVKRVDSIDLSPSGKLSRT